MREVRRLKAAEKVPPNPPSPNPYSFFARKTFIAVGVVGAAVLFFQIIAAARDVFLLVFAGILVAVLFRSLSDWLRAHTPLSEGGALAVVILLLFGLLGGIGWSLAPDISNQFDQLIQSLPRMIHQLNQRLTQHEWGRRLLAQTPKAAEQLSKPAGLIAGLAGLFSTAFGLLGNIVIVFFMGIYLAIDPASYRNGVVRLFPIDRRERIKEVLDQIGETLRWWLIARMIAMVVIGVLITVGLWFIGIQPALALGLLAGILNFIPYIGPILSAVPVLLIAFGQDPAKALYVGVLYLVVQWIDNHFVTPVIEKRTVSLLPVLTVTVQLLLGILTGALGIMLASPLAASLLVVIRMLYIEDALGDSMKQSS